MDPTEDWSGNSPATGNVPQGNGTEKREDNQVIVGYTSFHSYAEEAFDATKLGIKAANNLPIGSHFNYYSCFPSFLKAKDENTELLLNVMQHVLRTANITNNISNRDIEEKFDLLLEANDMLLDRANALMDKECGITKNSEVELVVTHTKKDLINGSWNNQVSQSLQVAENASSIRLLAGKNIQRPQLFFKDKIDNSSKAWCPRIKDKPNSLKPLAIYLEESEHGEAFNHPYEYELDLFKIPNNQLEKSVPVKYKSLEETQLVMVANPADIKPLLDDLKNYKQIAVDLEHHSYRSFQGITCLMQISTGDTDYLIDTLSLRSELHELNEIFTKPSILKVFHGADLDVQWLQRDLSLYVVNMFDTHQAAKQLNLPYLSLAYLLKRYCNVDPDKHFQMADWRIRPLPDKLVKYAREDTHYLLHIKDILKNALIDAANGQVNILKAVYDRSTEICKRTYVKPVWSEESCMSMYRKSQKMFNNQQLYALRELHKWRDTTAREEDDSNAYVLPNHMLLNIAETLPREMQGILACCDSIPPLVRQNLLKLHKIILKAREQPLIKPILEDLRQRLTQRSHIANSEAWMYTPHDIPSGTEARADLPCLLDGDNVSKATRLDAVVKHTVTVFDSPATSEDEQMEKNGQTRSKKKKFVFVSPFERYKRVIPMVAEEEARERERQRQEEEKRLSELEKEKGEIEESKARVYDHFKQVSQTTTPGEKTTTTREKVSTTKGKTSTTREKSLAAKEKSLAAKEKSSTSREKSSKPREKSSTPREAPSTPREKSSKPREKSSTPREKSSTPREKSSTPRDKSTPAKEKLTPAKEKLTLAKEKSTPAKEKSTPAKEKSTPAKEKSTLTKEKLTLAKEKLTPAKEKLTPAKEKLTPAKEKLPIEREKLTTPRERSSRAREKSLTAGGKAVVVEEKVPTPSKKSPRLSLSQMQGRKRKRDSNIEKQIEIKQEKLDDDFLTPAPSLKIRITQGTIKDRDEAERLKEEKSVQEIIKKSRQQPSTPDTVPVTSMRTRKKGDKKQAMKELEKMGMLPSKTFDYKEVDFSTFQGGSKNTTNQVNFEQTAKQKKEKPRKRKKQKLSI